MRQKKTTGFKSQLLQKKSPGGPFLLFTTVYSMISVIDKFGKFSIFCFISFILFHSESQI